MASNETSKYKLTVVEGTELKLFLNGAQGPAGAVGPAGPTGGVGPAGPQGPSGLSSSTFPYVAKTTSTSGDPLSTFITWDQADQITASTIRVSHIGSDTNDYDVLLSIIKGNDYVIIQSKTNSNKYQKFSVTGAPTIVPNSYIEIPVSNDSFGTSPTNFSNGDPILLIIQSVGLTGDPALLLAGGTMDADATITLVTTPDGNGSYLESTIGGDGFSTLQYIGSQSLDHYASITPYDIAIGRNTDANNISLSTSGGSTLTITSDNGASTQTTSFSGYGVVFDNNSKLSKGTTNAGLGGNSGIALKCSVDYELKWEAGRLYTMDQYGFTIRRVDHCGTTVPTATDDSTKGFIIGSIWTLDNGTSYECTSDSIDSAVWVAHLLPNDALPLAGGAMDTGAVITLDIAPDGNGFSTDSEVGGWGFGVQQKENGANTSLLSYIDTTGFYAESSPAYVTVNAGGIPSYGSLDGEIFRKVADFNFKPSYEGDLRLRYSGERWYMDDYVGTVIALADVNDESYPWQASWPLYVDSIIPSVNQTTHLSSTELTFDNGSKLKKGTTDAGLGGNGGIALKCSVDYELKWDAGRLYTMEQDGFTIRRVDHCRNITPTTFDDNTKGFVIGSIWTLDDGRSYVCTDNTTYNAVWYPYSPALPVFIWNEGDPEPVSQNVVALQIQASGAVTEGQPIPNNINITITFAGVGGTCSYTLQLTSGTVFNSTTIAASLASGLYSEIALLPATQSNLVYNYNNFVAVDIGAGNYADLTGISLTCNYGTASAPANLGAGGVIQYCTFIPYGIGQFIIQSYGTRQWICSFANPILWTEITNSVSTSTKTDLSGIVYSNGTNLISSPVYSTVTSASSALGSNIVFFNSTTSQAQVTDIYDADANAYITSIKASGAVVSDYQQKAITQFILDGKSTGWWSSIKRLYLPIWGSATPNATDMVSLTSGSFVGGITHALGYVQGDGTTGYFSTTDTPSSLGMTTSGGSCFALVNQADSRIDTRFFIGQTDASNRRVYLNQTGTSTIATTLYGAGASPTNSSTARNGMFLSVINATNSRYLKRISSEGIAFTITVTTNDTTLPSTLRQPYVMANNNNGTAANFSDARLGVYGFGLGMSSINGDKFSISIKRLWETCTGFNIP